MVEILIPVIKADKNLDGLRFVLLEALGSDLLCIDKKLIDTS
ncbi:hypothetical protein AOT82_2519 [Psychrobacter sp. AntiMn-1]|nr:hypothetical protein AOT82_2519 [Psychrobacter sp. AntiMn-1]